MTTVSIRLRRDTAANWASANPVLEVGQPGFDTTNRILKVGDGATAWSSLGAISSTLADGDYGDITVSGSGSVWSIDAAAKPVVIGPLLLSDETTAIAAGTAKLTMRMPHAMTLTAVRASLTTVSSSGVVTVDINEGGVSILSTKLTIDASELTSTTAAAAAVISDSALADDAQITFDIDTAGTGAAGLKVWLIGTR